MKTTSIFTLIALLTNVSATEPTRGVRELFDSDACSTESTALMTCITNSGGGDSCVSCLLGVDSNVNEGDSCDSLKATACPELNKCADSCGDCQAEMDGTIMCTLKQLGCDGNECSSGFKAKAVTASAAGAAFIWFLCSVNVCEMC